ncbi:MAG TPA: DALR anticodon-binding domain-containing protein [Streptosporangiaceae bacterium]|nr:DALR anticodon-binding domain-containing protein [Streptosporangiaceae bacterium]
MITAELRRAILTAAGKGVHPGEDPLLRPGPQPGSYASSLPFRLPRHAAAALPARLAREPWIAEASLTGPGYLTVTVTRDALAGLAVRIARAGPACAASDALGGRTASGPAAAELTAAELTAAELTAAPDWPSARAALAARLTARLAATAGATVIFYPERIVVPPPATASPVPAAVAYAGLDAVRFALARMPPGGRPPRAEGIARHVLGNPAYAVRYAHAAAAAVLRWAASLRMGPAGFQPRQLMAPPELALLDALSWLPERVAMAARRGRPDEFAGYLEELAARTIDTMSTTGFTTIPSISSERLWLADAARTGLAAGLGLLGVDAPSRL